VYLLDTNVVSELRRSKPNGAVQAWLETIDDANLSISAVTVGEIQAGVENIREQDVGKAAEIETWLARIIETHNVLPMDARAFRCWARLMHHRSNDHIEDAMIAATAEVHNLIVATRNVKDFKLFGARTFNPFAIDR